MLYNNKLNRKIITLILVTFILKINTQKFETTEKEIEN